MTFNDYINDTYNNAVDFIDENRDYYEDFDACFSAIHNSDSVTGNASGSFTFSAYVAKTNIAELIWDEDFRECAIYEFGYSWNDLMDFGPEGIDVIARCFALDMCYEKLENYYNGEEN